MKKLILLLLCACIFAGCTPSDNKPPPEVDLIDQLELPRLSKSEQDKFPRLDGSTALIPLAEALYALVFDVSRSAAADMVEFHGTNQSYYSLIYDHAGLILSYEPTEEVLMNYHESIESEYVEFEGWELAPIGRDALVFIVNESNPIDNLTTEQVQKIYTGEVTNWKELGGDDVEIEAFQRNATSGSQTLFMKLVMGEQEPVKPDVYYIPSAMGQLIESVVNFNNTGAAIGFSVYYYAQNMNPGDGLKFLSIDSVAPTRDTIRDGSYAHINDFYAGIRKDAKADSLEREIFDWLQSPQGRALIESENYVSINQGE